MLGGLADRVCEVPPYSEGSVIVYGWQQFRCDQVAQLLGQQGISAESPRGERPCTPRLGIQTWWRALRSDVEVCGARTLKRL